MVISKLNSNLFNKNSIFSSVINMIMMSAFGVLKYFIYFSISYHHLIFTKGRLYQIEYAMEAVKQGAATVAVKSKTHVVLCALKVKKFS